MFECSMTQYLIMFDFYFHIYGNLILKGGFTLKNEMLQRNMSLGSHKTYHAIKIATKGLDWNTIYMTILT